MRGLPVVSIAAVGTAAVLVAGASVWWWRARSFDRPDAEPKPGYVGDRSCRSCHSTIVASYQRTAMGRAWYAPSEQNLVEDYAENNHVYDAKRDLHYEMIARGAEFSQREYRLDKDGKVTHELSRKVAHIVGSGEHVRSYATEAGGYLTQMPVSWYTQKKQWGLSPGYELFNHRFDRPISPQCLFCHTDYAQAVAGTINRYENVPAGIGCERCHGPAEWHVREQLDAWEPPLGDVATIVNPARLPAERRNDVCFQCHLQGEVQFAYLDTDPFAFRPGMRLADYRSEYVAESPDPEKFGVASHATRMVQSRCFVASRGALYCITCHDPHVPRGDVARASYIAGCLSCHQPDACNRPEHAGTAHQQNDCVSCHMPQSEPKDVQHTVFTDHLIQRPRPARPETESRPRPVGLVVLHDFWQDERDRDEREGIAHVSFAVARGGYRPNLDRGIELLDRAAARGTMHLDGWRKLGMAGLTKGDPLLAAHAFGRALEKAPNDGMARLGLGLAYRMRGDSARALTQFEQAIQAAPDQLEPYLEAARIYFDRREADRARALLEASLERNPHQPAVLLALGMVVARDPDQRPAALDLLRRAIAVDPDNVAARRMLDGAGRPLETNSTPQP